MADIPGPTASVALDNQPAAERNITPVPSSQPLERINIAGMNVLINPSSITYTVNTRYTPIETQGGVVVQFGPEKPVDLSWSGKTTKDALGTVQRLRDIWKAQQYSRQSVRYVNPMRGEDYEVAITMVTHTEDAALPWRFDYRITFLILQDYSTASLHSAMENYNLGAVGLEAAAGMVLGATQSYTAASGETFQDISQKMYGTAAFAGSIRNTVAAMNPKAVSPTGEPVPGITMNVPVTVRETNYETTSVADYFNNKQKGSALDREKAASSTVSPRTDTHTILGPYSAGTNPDDPASGWTGSPDPGM